MTIEKFLQKERDWQDLWWLDQVQRSKVPKGKLAWNQGDNGTLFTFKSRNEFVNFSESDWNKIDQLWNRDRWKRKRIRGMRWWKFGVDAISFVLKRSRNVLAREDAPAGDSGSEFEGFRWRIVLKVFRVCKDWQMNQLQDWTKWGFGCGNEGSDWVALGSEFHAVKRKLPATPTSLKSTTFQ